MSGFAGIVSFTGEPISRERLNPLAIGLDATAIGAPRFWCSGPVGLIYRQRITTPEDRHDRQPLVGGSGSGLVFDGRLDDRIGLAAKLSQDFDTTLPDSAWVSSAFDRWNGEAVPHLIGDFALARWDERARRLVLARDRIGQRSLYYYTNERFLVFATTLRALLALPDVPRQLDEAGLADFLVLNPFDAEATIYRGIKRVPAAHRLTSDQGGIRLDRYWQLDPNRRLHFSRDQDYVEAARELLDQAVACRLRIAGPIMVMASGGLDSTGVAATAARLAAPATVHSLTAVPPEGFAGPVPVGKYPDERPYVRMLADLHPNLVSETLTAGGLEAIEEDGRRLFAAAAQPLRNVDVVAWFAPLHRRAVQLGARVLLCGDLGNMTLSYDGIGRIDELFAERRWLTLVRVLRQTGRAKGIAPWRLLARRIMPWRHIRDPSRLLHRRTTARCDWDDYSALNPAFASEIDLVRHFQGVDFNPAQRRLIGSYPAMLPRMLDGASSMFDGRSAQRALTGLDFRDPLADSRLLEFCMAIPSDQFLRNGQTRWLARRVLADRLPPAILNNRLDGAQCPEWFDRLNRQRDRISGEIGRLEASRTASRVLDVPRLKRLMADWPSDGRQAMAQIKAYRSLLTRGVHVGEFIRWVEGGNE